MEVGRNDWAETEDHSVEAVFVERFESFYRREQPGLIGLAYTLTGSRRGADDLAQDALFAAYRNWERISTFDDPGAWVRRVLANAAVSKFRRFKSEAKALARMGAPTHVMPDISAESAHVWAEVRKLPKRQSQCVALYYYEGSTVEDIAEILQVSTGAVKTHLSRARAKLEVVLGEGGRP
ncbi:MAG: SigE family RNA polymerase sigma factor [Acidimicrobiia bacterium]|nr:SigE family RNA polymerase sigma factor [Acidimicrobiia bacterium]